MFCSQCRTLLEPGVPSLSAAAELLAMDRATTCRRLGPTGASDKRPSCRKRTTGTLCGRCCPAVAGVDLTLPNNRNDTLDLGLAVAMEPVGLDFFPVVLRGLLGGAFVSLEAGEATFCGLLTIFLESTIPTWELFLDLEGVVTFLLITSDL